MGILSSFMASAGKMVGEQLFPFYENAQRWNSSELKNYIEDTTNKIYYRAACLLALSRKDNYKAMELYKNEKSRFENAFTQICNYYKFQPIVNEFRRRAASSSSY